MRRDRFRISDFGFRIVGDNSRDAVLNPHFLRFPLWFVAGGVAAVVVGWLAAKVHASGHAPLGLTSLGVGVVLGATLAMIAAMVRIAGLRGLLATSVLFAILAIAAEHAWLYLDFRGQWKESRTKTPAVAIFRPADPPPPREYFARDWNPKLWLADAAIIVATTIAVVIATRPYLPTSRHPTPDT